MTLDELRQVIYNYQRYNSGRRPDLITVSYKDYGAIRYEIHERKYHFAELRGELLVDGVALLQDTRLVEGDYKLYNLIPA